MNIDAIDTLFIALLAARMTYITTTCSRHSSVEVAAHGTGPVFSKLLELNANWARSRCFDCRKTAISLVSTHSL